MLLLVDVTQKDIDTGEESNCSNCPVALAILRALGGEGFSVKVKANEEPYCDVRVYHNGELWAVTDDLPGVADDFVWEFDLCFPVTPFQFQLELREP